MGLLFGELTCWGPFGIKEVSLGEWLIKPIYTSGTHLFLTNLKMDTYLNILSSGLNAGSWSPVPKKTPLVLGIPSISILSRDPVSGKPPLESRSGKRIRFLKRTVVEKNGQGVNP